MPRQAAKVFLYEKKNRIRKDKLCFILKCDKQLASDHEN